MTKTKLNRTILSMELERAQKTEAKGTRGLKAEIKRIFLDRLDNVYAFNEVKTKSKLTPGYGVEKGIENRTPDRLLAERVQEAKREQFTVEERAKFLHDIKVYSRAESCSTKELKPLENKPPTKNIKRFDDSFITVGSTEDERKIKEINEGASDPDKKKKFVKEDVSTKVPAKQDVAEQGTKKRKGTIDSEIMERKSFISKLDKASSPEGDYLCWLTIVNEKFKGNIQKATRSTYDSLGRLEDYDGILNRKFKDGTVIHMLVERKYPLSKELLHRKLDFGLEVEIESTATLDLIMFIKQQLNEERIARDVKEPLRSDQDLSECLNTSSMEFKESTPKKHEVKQVQQSCLGEDLLRNYNILY
ncbi:hypothetical protein Tco_1304873 [Tanacetum coccineum]